MQSLPTEYTTAPLSRIKQFYRKHYLEQRRLISAETRALLDKVLCLNTIELPCFISSQTLLAFYPLEDEPNVLPVINAAYRENKRVAFPVCDQATSTVTFHVTRSLEDLTVGAYGIPEPASDAPILTDFSDSFCMVPGVVFDANGYRIGYGKGYYDRFLDHYPGFTVGMVYNSLLIDSLPHESTDVSVSMIVTERGILLPNENNP